MIWKKVKCLKLLSNREKVVCSRIHREYNKFQYRVLKMEKEEIMNKCCKIRFYDCIKEYFQYNGDISEDIYQFLENKKDIIHCLWELYLKYENFDCSTWEQIDEMLEYWMYG